MSKINWGIIGYGNVAKIKAELHYNPSTTQNMFNNQ